MVVAVLHEDRDVKVSAGGVYVQVTVIMGELA